MNFKNQKNRPSLSFNAEEITHVFFDLDGVLLDTEQMYTDAAQKVLDPFGHVYTWELKEKMMGHKDIEAASILVTELDLPISPAEFVVRRSLHLKFMYPESVLKPGAEVLTQYFKQNKIPQAIVTSCHRESFELKMTTRPTFPDKFDLIVTGDDPDVKNGKPSPDIYLITATRLNVLPRKCLVFEDSPAGIEAARSAGMYVVAVPDSRLNAAKLESAHLVIRTLEEFDKTILDHLIRKD